MAKIETLVDDFATEINPFAWYEIGGSGFWEDGKVKCVASSNYPGVQSSNYYDLRESSVYLKWEIPSQGDTNGSRETTFYLNASATSDYIGFAYHGTPSHGYLSTVLNYGGTYSEDFIDPYDWAAFPFVRISLDVFQQATWDISADSVNWTTWRTDYGVVFDSVRIEVKTGQYMDESDTGVLYLDSVNVPAGGPPSVGSGPKIWDGTAWIEKPLKVWDGAAWVGKPMKVWDGSAWVLA